MARGTLAVEAPGDSSGAPANRRPRCYPILLLVAMLLLAAVFAWPSRTVLEIRGQDGAILYQRPVCVGERFVLRYTHSVARRPVEETFAVTGRACLILREATYDSFGAGLPTEPLSGEKMFLDGPVIRITGMNRVFAELLLAVGGIARHELRFHDGALALLDLVPAGASVRIRVVRRSIWRTIFAPPVRR